MTPLFDADADRAPRIGTWVKLGGTESVEIMAFAGFDFIVIDMEHTPLALPSVYGHIVTASSQNMPPLVRVPDHGASTIQRVLDAGAAGVLIPHVDTVDCARTVASYTRFPPHGTRGSGNTSRAGRWGLLGRQEYLNDGNTRALCITQLESRQAIENAGAILALPEVNGALVGASDLALEAGLKADDPALTAMVDAALDAARDSGKPIGYAIGSNPDFARVLFDRGFAFVVMSNDLSMLAESACSLLTTLRSHIPTSATAGV